MGQALVQGARRSSFVRIWFMGQALVQGARRSSFFRI